MSARPVPRPGGSGRYARRRAANAAALGLSVAATAIGLAWLGWILWTLVRLGAGGLSWTLFTETTPPPGESGGLANAIAGSVLLTALGTAVGAPLGVLAGTYLSEYGRGGRLGSAIRFVNDVLLSAPSILIGVFVYGAVVVPMGHFSGWAGGLALAVIVIPVTVRTTESALRLVPERLREAAAALGAPRWRIATGVTYRAARAGILTGLLLAVARISGETAPLLFTALNHQFWSLDMNAPIANLPVTMFHYAMSPFEDWQRLAWAGALLITVAVLALNVLARALSRRRRPEAGA